MLRKFFFVLCLILLIFSVSFTQSNARFQFNFVDKNENPLKPVHVGARKFTVHYTISCKECSFLKGNLGCSTLNEVTSYGSCGYSHEHSDKLILTITAVYLDDTKVSSIFKPLSQERSFYTYLVMLK